MIIVTLLLRAKQTEQTIKPDTQHVRFTLTHLQTLLTDLPSVPHVGRLLSQKARIKFLKNQSEKFL